jgi:hypothetical protein
MTCLCTIRTAEHAALRGGEANAMLCGARSLLLLFILCFYFLEHGFSPLPPKAFALGASSLGFAYKDPILFLFNSVTQAACLCEARLLSKLKQTMRRCGGVCES